MGENPTTVPRRVGLAGGGVIGGGWAARWLFSGADVTVFDPAPDAAEILGRVVDHAAAALRELHGDLLPQPGTWRVVSSLAEAVEDADLVHESVPEREDLKQAVLAEIDAATPAEALICSSTSGLLPSRLQAGMTHPERFLVAHPFNPVYLLPLVELCGSVHTAAETLDRAAKTFTAIGMRPLVVRHEVDGFIADRLLEALWREALWLVAEGVATTEEIDDAIRYGPGLRWASMGTMLTYRIAGGSGGMRHFMAQFGPALKLPWTKLVNVPELDEEFIERIAQQSDAQASGRDVAELEQVRDACVVAVLKALRSIPYGAGEVILEHETQLAARAATHDEDPFQHPTPIS